MMSTERRSCQRIGSVTSASVPRWGRMDAKAMLTHLKQSALMALGELPVANKSKRAFQVFPIKHLILHVVPFPKGAPTAPELLVPDAASVDDFAVAGLLPVLRRPRQMDSSS